ncbi:recombinase family protein [Vibrio alginolyticus]|uniref:recombinase family protein n=1 Tax=Vibrio alginolyticus TaxID=663 RepID=UPI00186A9134|nr:recombinase family protein [Vibrio parahaemolyticus]EIO3988559.1 recombinase family protein [Vibrio parahaemolyticus]MBE4521733.1 recombinase family protein [Vibrio parahaemolyticus]HAS6076782.1 recombinase family protein [Vibrio vulnificus]
MIKKSKEPQVYSYSRFSDLEQSKGSSLARQEDYAKKAAKEYGLALNDELKMEDLGKSAFRAEHKKAGAYGAFLQAVNKGWVAKGSYLIVENFDRLSREQARLAQKDINELIEADINIITATDNQLYNKKTIDQNPYLMFLMTGTMIRAHEESLTKQKRSISAIEKKLNKFRDGKPVDVGGPLPFWLERIKDDPDKLFDYSDKVEAARIITKGYLSGRSYGQIQDQLTEHGIKTPKGDERWGTTTISKVLENHALYGRKVVRLPETKDGTKEAQEHTLDNYYPALISKGDFDLIQQIKKVKKKGRTGYRFNSSKEDGVKSVVYLLSGYGRDKDGKARSVCSKCGGGLGSRLVDQYTRKKEYVRTVMRLDCLNRTRKKSCTAKGIAQSGLEKSFLLAISDHIDYSLLNKEDSDVRAVEVIDSKIEELDGIIERASDLYLLGKSSASREKAKAQLVAAEAERELLLSEKDEGKEFVISPHAIREFQDFVLRAYEDDNDFEARRYVKDILLQCVEKLVVDTQPKDVASLGFSNLYKDARVWTVKVDFRSGKRITVYHDCDTNMSLFNMIEGGDSTFHSYTPEALQIFDSQGPEAFVQHLRETGFGTNTGYIQDFISTLEEGK